MATRARESLLDPDVVAARRPRAACARAGWAGHHGVMSAPRPRPRRGLVGAIGFVLVLVAGAVGAGAATVEWNVGRIGAPRSAAGTVVAVVDTGVDRTHPVFGDRVLDQIDVRGDGEDGDPHGHGTHVAGTAAGDHEGGCGGIGVAPDATILPVRVLDENGEGTVSDVDEGIRRAADAMAQYGGGIVNLSLGSEVVIRNLAGSGIDDAIEYAWDKGSIPVLAAGNDGLVGSLFGSGYGDVPAVVVTATDHEDEAAPYATSIGSARWGIAAPGGDGSEERGRDIWSAHPDQRCALLAGTSMAAPHVSGALAVLRARGLSPSEAVDTLLDTARHLGSEDTYGAGLVDLAAAVAATTSTSTSTTTTTTTTSPAPTATTAAGSGDTGAPSSSTTTSTPSTTDTVAESGEETTTTPPEPTSTEAGTATTTTEDDAASTTSPTDARNEGDVAAGVTVVDEDDDGVPGALVAAAAAGALAVGTAAGTVALRSRRS